ncbi:MAG: GGDEF domain-containing protein, partial [Stappiaceae bacterium]
ETEKYILGLTIGALAFSLVATFALCILIDTRLLVVAIPVAIILPLLIVPFVGRIAIATRQQLNQANDKLQFLATHDSLTGLSNRRGFFERARKFLAKSDRTLYGLLILDIDQFKMFNDQNGYTAGDTVLRTIAGILVDHAPQNSCLCRFAGEEFIVLSAVRNKSEIGKLAASIQQAIAMTPIYVSNNAVTVSVTVGAALSRYPDILDGMLQDAEKALAAAQQVGPGGYEERDVHPAQLWTQSR